MFFHVSKNDIFNFCTYTTLIVMVLSFNSFAQSTITIGEIIDALDTKLSEAELIKQIEKQKVDFYLKSSDSVDLVFPSSGSPVKSTLYFTEQAIRYYALLK